MAGYPQNTLKLVMGGVAGGDIWRSSIDLQYTSGSGQPTSADLNNMLSSSAVALFSTFWGSTIRACNDSSVDFSVLQAYSYLAGTSKAHSSGVASFTALPGSNGSGQLTYRSALVISKLTAYAGRANRGRMYLPLTCKTMTSTHQFQSTDVSGTVNDLAILVRALNTANWSAYNIASQLCVVTSARAAVGANPITRVRGTSMPDTQRRRTNKDNPVTVSAVNI